MTRFHWNTFTERAAKKESLYRTTIKIHESKHEKDNYGRAMRRLSILMFQ